MIIFNSTHQLATKQERPMLMWDFLPQSRLIHEMKHCVDVTSYRMKHCNVLQDETF